MRILLVVCFALLCLPVAVGQDAGTEPKLPDGLSEALWQGRTEAVLAILKDKPDLRSASGRSLLVRSIQRGQKDVAKAIVECGAPLNPGRQTLGPLHVALEKGEEELARLLLQKGADVNAIDDVGRTPLYYAAVGGKVALVRLLVEKGAKVNLTPPMPGYWDSVPLHGASNVEVAKALLELGATEDPNRSLLYAQDGAIAELLLERGAQADNTNQHGENPLCWAARDGRTDVARVLLDHGTSVTCWNLSTGLSLWDPSGMPLDLALRQGHRDTVDLLLARGATKDQLSEDDAKLLDAMLRSAGKPAPPVPRIVQDELVARLSDALTSSIATQYPDAEVSANDGFLLVQHDASLVRLTKPSTVPNSFRSVGDEVKGPNPGGFIFRAYWTEPGLHRYEAPVDTACITTSGLDQGWRFRLEQMRLPGVVKLLECYVAYGKEMPEEVPEKMLRTAREFVRAWPPRYVFDPVADFRATYQDEKNEYAHVNELQPIELVLDMDDDGVDDVLVGDRPEFGLSDGPWHIYMGCEDGRFLLMHEMSMHRDGPLEITPVRKGLTHIKAYYRDSPRSGTTEVFEFSKDRIRSIESHHEGKEE